MDTTGVASQLTEQAARLIADGRGSEAEPLLREAMADLERSSDRPSPQLVDVTQSLARLLISRGEGAEATTMFERSLAMKRQLLGPNHPQLAIQLHDWALLCDRYGWTDQARMLWTEAEALLDLSEAPAGASDARDEAS
ncbi:MAG TPA: tetratricopeptide repeat protein [Acidimicrobiia bacterium]|jgi:hypothetical protein|nr:tetratricopeptide repeat protein [Acidimicrobiia bacterium]